MDDTYQEKRERGNGSMLRNLVSPFWPGNRQGLANWFAGVTFGGKRDSYETLGYKRVLFPKDYRARYKRGGIAASIVDSYPEAAWRGGGAVYDDPDPKVETPFEKAFKALNKKHKIWQVFERAHKLANLGRYAIILIGAPGDFDTPLTTLSEANLRYLTPYCEDDARIIEYDQDFQSERYGLPVRYTLSRTYVQWPGQMNPPIAPAKPVHWSRIIHVADGLLDDRIFGRPRLEAVWNLLDDLDKVIGGGAESFWKRADGGTVYNLDPTMPFSTDPTKEQEAKERIERKISDFQNELKRDLVVRGIDVKRLGSDIADLKGPAAALMDQISATTRIPQRILMGSEQGKLAASKDKSNWDDRVQDVRDNFCDPMVVHGFLDRMIQLGVVPPPKNDEYFADWPEQDELDEVQRISAALQVSMINKNDAQIIVTPSEIRTVYLNLPPMTDDQKAEIQEIEQKQQEKALQMQKSGPGAAVPDNSGGDGANNTDIAGGGDAQLTVALRAMELLDVEKLEEHFLNGDQDAAAALIEETILSAL